MSAYRLAQLSGLYDPATGVFKGMINLNGAEELVPTVNSSGQIIDPRTGSAIAVGGLSAAQVPVGAVDGANAVFTVTGAISLLFKNGVYQAAGGVDYTLAGTTITYATAPSIGDTHVAL